ncbi:hypothetical protein [Wolbachia endosymbiont (group A) of Barypeithes pellucidus]|uniref:hypothetical protein n=1 Tax=Wolbachia endosymbiont (group A) of Barypeithes pellucidus TaxID=3139322 RepID=UPI003CCA977D
MKTNIDEPCAGNLQARFFRGSCSNITQTRGVKLQLLPNIGFKRLAEILDALGKNGHNLDATKKEELRVFLEGVLKGKEGETSENIVSAFREKLKTEAKDELKADQATITAAKDELKTEELKTEAKNELSNEMQEKVNKLEQIEKEKTDLQTKFDQEKQALEAKNKTTEQPKQGNGARYTATVGMGLAAGLIAFTALERTVRLDMSVMIGIAVASALVVGGVTYAALPSTQVDGAKAQEVDGNNKGK